MNPHDELIRYRAELRASYYHRTGDSALADEIAQEAVARGLRAIREGKRIHHPRGWLYRVARNLFVDETRRPSLHSIGLEALIELKVADDEVAGRRFTVNGHIIDIEELLDALPRALEQIPPRFRTPLELRYCRGDSWESIAEQSNISVRNAKIRGYRGRNSLRRILFQAVASPLTRDD